MDDITKNIQDNDGWYRSPDHRQFIRTGSFTSWIVGSKNPLSPGSAGVSCAAWYVTRDDESELPARYARTSDDSKSDEYRAAVAATLRSLETLPANSKIKILTRLPAVAEALNGNMRKWESEGWINPGDTSKRNAWEIWERIIKLSETRGLQVAVEYKEFDDKVFKQLREWALVLAKEKSKEIGDRPGDYHAHRKGQPTAPNAGHDTSGNGAE
jgi:ribonuclease HI